ncbi:site-specific integrase [Streptomyces sp. NBC_01525]|uniref:tyrosine-type recombinase/integrase n=1 Tax=Streptomyces sp. NBC_01525 TaxID=2903893 RepID=UPI00386B01D8
MRAFCHFVTDPLYEWTATCEERFGTHPVQVVHEWNTAAHVQDNEADAKKRAFTKAELHAFFAHYDDEVARIRAFGRKGWPPAFRDATLFKTAYAYGLRRNETRMLDAADFGRNPHGGEFGEFGRCQVRFGKAKKGSPPKRRGALTVFDWTPDVLDEWFTEVRPLFGTDNNPAAWPSERDLRIGCQRLNSRFITYRKALGLDDGLDFHSFRRSYVTHLIEDGWDPRFVQEQVGHEHASTTSLYTNRPGGAQAIFLAEIGKEEESRNQTLTLQAFRDYQAGRRPSGPGAQGLLAFFASVERQLEELDVTAPTVKRSDQELINLLAIRAGALHLGLANHCWFLDPGKALCLKLARSSDRSRPLVGMCDSARCQQATHHSCHRIGWRHPPSPAEPSSARSDAGRRPSEHDSRPKPNAPSASSPRLTSQMVEKPMGQISSAERQRNEERIRAAMDRLLCGELPPGGRCDLKSLAGEAGVNSTGFYPKKDPNGTVRDGPYQHLAEEFVRRLKALQEAGTLPDPRDAQVARLKAESNTLLDRLARQSATIEELTSFKTLALSRIAAQQEEIIRLRSPQPNPDTPPVARLTTVPGGSQTIGSCS